MASQAKEVGDRLANEVRREMRIEKVEELAQLLKENPDLAKAQMDKINHNLQGAIKASLSMLPPPSHKKSHSVDVRGVK